MNISTLTELYEEYTHTRRINLSYEQFGMLIMYYPALLVAKTDGEIDEHEWSTLQNLANQLVAQTLSADADQEEVRDYQRLFFDEFRYLTDYLDVWDRKFMKALKYLIAEHPEAGDTVANVIYSLADASQGICEKENIMIEYLRSELAIKQLNREIAPSSNALIFPKSSRRQPKWQVFMTFLVGF